MKKSLLILSAISLFALAGCGTSKGGDKPTEPDTPVNPKPTDPETPEHVKTNYTVAEFNKKIDSLVEAVPATKTDLGLKTEFQEQTRYDYDIEGIKSYLILHKHTVGGIYVQNDLAKIVEDDITGQKYTTLDAEGNEASTQKTISENHETLHRQLSNPFAHYVSTGTYTIANNPEETDHKNGKIPMNHEFKLVHEDAKFNKNTEKYLAYTREERTKYLFNSFKQVGDFKLGAEITISSETNALEKSEVFTINIIQNNENTTDYKEQHLTMKAMFTVKNNLVEDLTQNVKLDAILTDGSKMKVKQDYAIEYVTCPKLTFPEIAPEVKEPDEISYMEPVGIFPFGFNYNPNNN